MQGTEMPRFRTVRGMRDFLPKHAGMMRYVDAIICETGVFSPSELEKPV